MFLRENTVFESDNIWNLSQNIT